MAPGARSTADFEVAHVHSFGAHVLVLILCKGPLHAGAPEGGSRLVASKGELGFRFPCDGPGRGGSCQVSSWDHVYLALFWLYNLLSALLFGAFWKLQGSASAYTPFREAGVCRRGSLLSRGRGAAARGAPSFPRASRDGKTIGATLGRPLWNLFARLRDPAS
jgi:hypothetical protein